MRISRFFCFAAAACLVVLVSCGNPPVSNNGTSPDTAASPAAVGKPEMNNHSYGGKPKININTAILSELDRLEAQLAIPALSNKIQASRPYSKPEDLVSKNVITQAQFDQIKDQVTIADVELTGTARDVDYMTKLGLMKGHLLVAKELLDAGNPKQAEPHIGHPVEEIYVDVEDQLQERGVPEFKTTLIAVQDLVKSSPQDAKIQASFQSAMQAVDTAIAALPETQRQSPEFVLQVITNLLDAAGTEYQAAVANGKIAEIIEYQDSRGFVIYADSLYQSIATEVAKLKPDSDKSIRTNMAQLQKAWPSAIASSTPVLSPEQVSGLIKAIAGDTQAIAMAKR
jgi:hypothetical protein